MTTIVKTPYAAHHGFEWSPVLIGSVIAVALTIVLMQFGTAVGYSGEVDIEDKNLTHWSVVVLGLWVLFVQLISSFAGGYVAGYSRSVSPELADHENEMRNGIYGVGVWATSTVLVFIGASFTAAIAALTAGPIEVSEAVQTLTDRQENAIIIAGFALGAISMVSIAASWWAAVMGGHHRAHAADFSDRYSFLKK